MTIEIRPQHTFCNIWCYQVVTSSGTDHDQRCCYNRTSYTFNRPTYA